MCRFSLHVGYRYFHGAIQPQRTLADFLQQADRGLQDIVGAQHAVAEAPPAALDPLGGLDFLDAAEHGNLAHLHQVDADRVVDLVVAAGRLGGFVVEIFRGRFLSVVIFVDDDMRVASFDILAEIRVRMVRMPVAARLGPARGRRRPPVLDVQPRIQCLGAVHEITSLHYCPSDPVLDCGDHSHSVSTVNAESAPVVRQIARPCYWRARSRRWIAATAVSQHISVGGWGAGRRGLTRSGKTVFRSTCHRNAYCLCPLAAYHDGVGRVAAPLIATFQ